MKRFSLNKIRKSIWFGIGFGMTAYFMAGCSDNDSSEYIELAAKITLTQSEYYNNEGETTLHPWTKDDKAGIFVIRDNFLQKINISPIQTQSPKSLFLLNFKAPKHSNATLVAFYPADANLIYEDDILKTTIPTTQTGTVAPLLIGQTTGRIDSYEGLHMELKHLFNTMYIPVWGSHAIAKAVIQANGGEAIAGETSIRLKDGVICASEKSVTVKFSTPLDCSAEIKLIPVMLAPVTLSQGYSVTIYDINGISYTVSSDKPITLTAGGKADADEARSPYVIETISFNIRVDNPSDGDNIWKNRKQAVITMINRQQPTIMGLQEAQPHQITYLAKQCPEYAWYGLGRDTGEAPPKTETYASEECMAIFFQTSIVEMLDVNPAINVTIEDGHVVLAENENAMLDNPKQKHAFHGLYRSLVHNMVVGVSEGYKKELELVGVGYRASNQGNIIELALGYTHSIFIQLPPEVKVETKSERNKNPLIILESCDKQLLGQVCSKIRSFRKPEPYKGKGIKFVGEEIRRKSGKSAGAK